MNRYNLIENKICPECRGKLTRIGEDYDDKSSCNFCGLTFKFNDDMGPGSYATLNIKGGRAWKKKTLKETSDDLAELAHYYSEDISPSGKELFDRLGKLLGAIAMNLKGINKQIEFQKFQNKEILNI